MFRARWERRWLNTPAAAPTRQAPLEVAHCRLLWDLDNLPPRGLKELPRVVQQLRASVGALAGCEPRLSAYANARTVARLGGAAAAAAALEALGAELVLVHVRK